jgi:hypothetical protein
MESVGHFRSFDAPDGVITSVMESVDRLPS